MHDAQWPRGLGLVRRRTFGFWDIMSEWGSLCMVACKVEAGASLNASWVASTLSSCSIPYSHRKGNRDWARWEMEKSVGKCVRKVQLSPSRREHLRYVPCLPCALARELVELRGTGVTTVHASASPKTLPVQSIQSSGQSQNLPKR